MQASRACNFMKFQARLKICRPHKIVWIRLSIKIPSYQYSNYDRLIFIIEIVINVKLGRASLYWPCCRHIGITPVFIFDTVDNPKFPTRVPDLIFCISLFLMTLFYCVFVYVNTLALGLGIFENMKHSIILFPLQMPISTYCSFVFQPKVNKSSKCWELSRDSVSLLKWYCLFSKTHSKRKELWNENISSFIDPTMNDIVVWLNVDNFYWISKHIYGIQKKKNDSHLHCSWYRRQYPLVK